MTTVVLDPRMARELRSAGGKSKEWTERRDALIRAAHEGGASLREIADAVGMSNPGVLRIVRKGTSYAPPEVLEVIDRRLRELGIWPPDVPPTS